MRSGAAVHLTENADLLDVGGDGPLDLLGRKMLVVKAGIAMAETINMED